ncbi:MAG: galactose-1-phosphate uridylyltransferase [Firmicutes bacterium]|nr:galactose-1-phosphate uridylyltransferase [Bacillota bacterium]
MSQIRKDIITGDWVIFASNRRKKPYHFNKKSITTNASSSENCPFCPGHEAQTPPDKYCDTDGKNWNIRVFENLYPAVESESCDNKTENFYESEAGFGIHEVVVDTPNHFDDPEDFDIAKLIKLFGVIKMRLNDIKNDERIKYIQIFKNNGPEAGASIAHSHWQIIGVPIVPPEQKKAVENMKRYKDENDECVLCKMVVHELKNKERIINENKSFIAIVPYAAKYSFEVMMLPKRHVSSFADFEHEEIEDMASMFSWVLHRVKKLKHDIGYNICFQEKPEEFDDSYFHWYMKIFPRLGSPAGFEFATGCYINPLLPEVAAEKYRAGESWDK